MIMSNLRHLLHSWISGRVNVMSLVTKQKEKLAELIKEALINAKSSGELSFEEIPEIELEIPREKQHGDFASNIALTMARFVKKPPRVAAEIIVSHINDREFLEKVEVAGPGFINFYLGNNWLYDVLKTIQNQGNQYGNSDLFRGKKLLLEFVSANPVGPMNVVNARAAAIGDTLARIFKAAGYDVATEYYVNDAGNQTNVFARSLEARYLQVAGIDCEFPEDGYPGEYVTELAEVLWNENPGLLNLPEEERLEVIRQWGIDQMVEMQRADLAQFGVEFDRWFSEQSLHKEQALEKVMALLDERGFIFQAEDATWFKSTEFGDDKDRVLVKSDGSYTYVTADIAYHYDKLKRGFTKLLDIWGPDHHGYIARMKAAIQALGYSEDTLEVLILQYVSLLRDGQQVKMSKRAGEFVTMQDLLDEVGKDAARYFFLMRSPESHLDFDLTLASEQTNENPVFYIQYAYARICSILRQAQEMEVEIVNIDQAPLHVLTEDIEIDLMKKLADLPDEIRIAAENREPHRIARYALDLASLFHSFYNHCRVLGEEEPIKQSRLNLIKSVQVVLSKVLDLLGIDAPERM